MPQPGATLYEVLIGDHPLFTGACAQFITSLTAITDPATPNLGEAYYAMVRPISPGEGEWGFMSLMGLPPAPRDPACFP